MRHKHSGSSIVEIGRATPSTLEVFPEGDASGFHATGRTGVVITGNDGKPVTLAFAWVIKLKTGSLVPCFDPEKAQYLTPDHLTNVASENGVQRLGAYVSANRIMALEHEWKPKMDFDKMLEHKHNSPLRGDNPVTREAIIASYAALRAATDLG